MKSQTAAQLHSLNKQFYQTFGNEFSSTRQRLQPGVLRVLDHIGTDQNILDLGCGNGELARELMRRGHRGHYTGLDFSLSLLEVARHGWEDSPNTFIKADLTSKEWVRLIPAGMAPFDLVTAFAVLHHIPGRDGRLTILKKAHDLLRPGGSLIHSVWQFLNSEKLKSRIQPWEKVGLSTEEVDVNDYLLDWRSGGQGLRYVHHFDEAELQELAETCGFRVRETFRSDGTNGLLALYQTWEAI
jgi:tRNA (uracil-5-)-methyltransferase TRM9